VFDAMTRFLSELLPNHIVIVNQASENQGYLNRSVGRLERVATAPVSQTVAIAHRCRTRTKGESCRRRPPAAGVMAVAPGRSGRADERVARSVDGSRMTAQAQLTQLILHYGYLAMGATVFAENLGMPVPGETAVFIAAGAAAAGHLNVLLVWLVAVCAAIVGDNVGFAFGHFGGKPVFERWGPRFGISHENYAATERFFDRFGGPAVMVARFVPVMRVVASLAAGASGMKWNHFLPWQAAGACLWAGYAVAVGYFGDRAMTYAKPLLIEEFGRWWPLVIVAAIFLALGTVAAVSKALARRMSDSV
jgi:membrane protein DedA with SNARE-associated domain